MSSAAEAIATLTSMGFPREQAEQAYARSGNDIELAANILSRGLPEEDDGEFDLIAQAHPEPRVAPPTVFHPRIGGHEGVDHFQDDVQEGASASELLDARLSAFTAMGFTVEQAETALRACNNDINEALTLLLGGDA